MGLDAVIFDWGGTLTVGEVSLDECLVRWESAAAHLVPHAAGHGASELFRVERDRWDRGISEGSSFTLHQVLTDGADALGVADTGAIERAAGAYLSTWAEGIVHDPDAADVLRQLAARGLRLGLLSNTHWPRAFHEELLARDALDVLLHSRHYSSELDHLKPHPEAFRAALRGVGDPDPRRVLFVGDRPLDDIRGAQALGMHTAWRPNPHVPPEPHIVPDAVISSLHDLLPLVDRLLARA